MIKKQEEITKLKEELKTIDIANNAHLREKEYSLEQAKNELQKCNQKLTKQLEEIDKCSKESTQYKIKSEEQEKEIGRLRQELNRAENSTSNSLSSLNSQIKDKEEQVNKLQADMSRRLTNIEKLEGDFNALQRRYDSAIQEIGRLESKLQTTQIDSQNENDLLKDELQKREDFIYKLKLDKENFRDQFMCMESKLRECDAQFMSMKQQITTQTNLIKSKEESAYQAEKNLDDLKTKYKQLCEENDRYDMKLRESEKALNELQAIKDDIESKVGDIRFKKKQLTFFE